MIEVLTTGLLNSVQDMGRTGYRDMGVGVAGAMDRLALEIGNILAGNGREAAGIEAAFFPFRLKFLHDIRFAVTGADCAARLDGDPLPPFWSCVGKAGQVLSLNAPVWGARAYITVAGGIDVPAVLGSRSTDLKAGFGGFEGRGLMRGDLLPISCPGHGTEKADAAFGAVPSSVLALQEASRGRARVVRFVPAAEYDEFAQVSLADFTASDWLLTRDANRIGFRLEGPVLRREQEGDLFSHGIVPGTIQVPPSGQPIIPLSDANTCGGYPKIGTVVESDLWKLAQTSSGQAIRFEKVDIASAVNALRSFAEEMLDIRRAVSLVARWTVPASRPAGRC